MAHDPARTRSLLLSAAVGEFSQHGYAGARIERISSAAGVNRERLYSYFGDKRRLFEAVLAERLATALDAAPVRGTGPQAAADFAADYFDACLASADLPRLVAWEGLELSQPIEVDARRERACGKVEELRAALPDAGREQVEDLLLTVVTLCHGWFTGPNLGRIIAGDETAHDRRRAEIAATARALLEVRAPRRSGSTGSA
jgi:AcrR family transcriptional regulator